MKIYKEQALTALYDSIQSKNRAALLAGGTPDPFLACAAADTRMSLALVFRPTAVLAKGIAAHLERLRAMEPELYYYPASDLHVTVMDILKGMPGRELPADITQYIQCIKACSQAIHAFEVEFRGLVASDNAVMVKGFYEAELETFRESLRHAFALHSLPLEERYKTVSCHITAARISSKLRDPQGLLAFLAEPVTFGRMEVDALELVFHNWYDSQKTVLAKIPLR